MNTGSKKFNLKLDALPNSVNSSTAESDKKNDGLPLNLTKYVDPSGKLSFVGKAVLHATGVDFTEGDSFRINFAELEVIEEIGRGQFGVVSKVFHKPTNVMMAMKQIRLEISEAAFRQIIMELDVLHKAHSRLIVDFYGAFFLESCAYICMEYMDAGSLDRLYGSGLDERILCRVAKSIVDGLKFLKEEMSIIHRDVKPSNVLVNLQGEIKLCDFGVSGQLIQSMAKTNIGCQTYMAPERIAVNQELESYSVSSDVWSLGLTLWEAAAGRHPFLNSKYDSLFAQLNAIVNEVVPELPTDRFSAECRDFVNQCLSKNPMKRPSYKQLLEHQFFIMHSEDQVDLALWAKQAHEEYLKKVNKV